MKRSFLVQLLVLGTVVSLFGTGCKHKAVGTTPIPGRQTTIANPGPQTPTNPGIGGLGNQNPGETNLKTSPEGTELGSRDRFEDRPVDYKPFEADVVYFDFDRSTIRPSERSKIEDVATKLKAADPKNDLLVEGHCDERGTDEYNRALGERRALSIREYLIGLGIQADRIRTISYGKDKPADPGHDEAAWSKNRRGVFGMLLPKP